MDRIFYVEHDSISGASACGQPKRRVHRDIVALVAVCWLLLLGFAMGASAAQAVEFARTGIHKHSRTVHYLCILRRGQRNFDYVDSKQSGVWVFVGRFT